MPTTSVSFITPAVSEFLEVNIDTAASGNTTLVPGKPGKTIQIFRLFLYPGGTTNVLFLSKGTRLCGQLNMTATSPALILDHNGNAWMTTAVNEDFIINNSAAVQIGGKVYYKQS